MLFMPQPLTDQEFDYIYTRVPRACVDFFIEDSAGLLLLKREEPPEEGSWHMPGGGIRFQESLADAAKRIAKRELGVSIEVDDAIGYDEYIHESRTFGDAHSIGIIIKAKIVSGDMSELIKIGKVKSFKILPEDTLSVHKLVLAKAWQQLHLNK